MTRRFAALRHFLASFACSAFVSHLFAQRDLPHAESAATLAGALYAYAAIRHASARYV